MVSPYGVAALSFQPAPELSPEAPLIAVEERQMKNLFNALEGVGPRIKRAFMIELLGQETVDDLYRMQNCDAQIWHSTGCTNVREVAKTLLNKL